MMMETRTPKRVRASAQLLCAQCPFWEKTPNCRHAFYHANGYYCDNIPITINTGEYVYEEE